jgi:hypothetical protein
MLPMGSVGIIDLAVHFTRVNARKSNWGNA